MRRLLLCTLAAASAVSAQSNAVPGLDGRLEILDDLTHFGHRGTFPNGEEGCAMRNTMCNPGSVNLPWFAVPLTNHPKFGFLIVRESAGRLVQISDRSFCKHAFTSASTDGGCGTCNGIGGNMMGLRCSDTYQAGHNASRPDLGPPDEIDPWLGTWQMVGSYFDRGDPAVGGSQATDGNYSLNTSGFDSVKNRVTIKDADLNVAGASYFYGIHLIHEGEPIGNRGDNLASRGFVPTWGGSGWSFTNNSVGQAWGSILQRWTGATLNSGGNGNDDGRFFVASKVTPLGGGNFHYEYAVHNVDNHRGGAALRIPVAAGATVTAFGFKDIDSDALNQWTAARVGNEIVFQASANNALNWNSIFNFWFDCTQAPSLAVVNIDEARIGPGSLTVAVTNVDTPSGGTPYAFSTSIGTGCAGGTGPCTASVYEAFPNAASFDLANSSMGLTFNGADYVLGPASGSYTAPSGSSLLSGDDVEAIVNLPFTLSFPGGSTTQLFVCSNGFVSPASNGIDFTVDTAVFLGGGPRWAAAWHDYFVNPGQVQVSSSPTVVRISFTNVPTLGPSGSHTFQYEFRSTNQVNIYWQGMSTSNGNYLTGWTAGNDGNNPPSSNLSAVIPAGNLTLCAGSQSILPLGLSIGSRPILGTNVAFTTTNIPVGSPAQGIFYSMTQAVPPVDLGPLGMPGCTGHMNAYEVLVLNANPSVTRVDQALIPNQPYLVGVTVVVQAVSNSPGRNPFGWLSSNGLLLYLAAQ